MLHGDGVAASPLTSGCLILGLILLVVSSRQPRQSVAGKSVGPAGLLNLVLAIFGLLPGCCWMAA